MFALLKEVTRVCTYTKTAVLQQTRLEGLCVSAGGGYESEDIS